MSKSPFSCKHGKSLICGLVCSPVSVDADELAWGAVPAVTGPCVCAYVLLAPSTPQEPSQHTQTPSLPFDPRSPPLREGLLLFALLSDLQSVQTNTANSPSLAFPLHHLSSDLASLPHPRRRSPGSSGHSTAAFEKAAPGLAMRCPRLRAPKAPSLTVTLNPAGALLLTAQPCVIPIATAPVTPRLQSPTRGTTSSSHHLPPNAHTHAPTHKPGVSKSSAATESFL